MKQIKYREGYKYQLAEEYRHKTEIIGLDIDTEFIRLTPVGMLIIKSGYAWDGASGPTADTKNSMRGSLVHDALYQLMRWSLIPLEHRKYADKLLRDICVEDGMNVIRAEMWESAVQWFAEGAASPEAKKEVITAP